MHMIECAKIFAEEAKYSQFTQINVHCCKFHAKCYSPLQKGWRSPIWEF